MPEMLYRTQIQNWETETMAHVNKSNVNNHLLSIQGSGTGDVTAILTLVARDEGGAQLECQVMLCPVRDECATKSYQECADGYLWLGAAVAQSKWSGIAMTAG